MVLTLVLVRSASVSASTVCTAEEFCVTENVTLTSEPTGFVAGAPLTVDLSVANTSTPLTRARWVKSVSFALPTPQAGDPPPVTPSSQLPDKLLIAGGGSCGPPSYSGCAGGHGTIVAQTDFGDTTGAFGVEKIVNVQAAPAGALAAYEMTFKFCIVVPFFGCQAQPTEVLQIFIPAEGPGELTIPTEGSGEVGGFNIEFSITSLSIHLDGKSNRIDGQAAPTDTYEVISVPPRCGPLHGSATFESNAAGTITIPREYTATGCPTASLAPPTRTGATVDLDGSASSTPVAGRQIARWHWSFGDGTEAVTTTPTVSHDFQPGATYTVSLEVEDSDGALSDPVTRPVTLPPGVLLTVSVSGQGTVAGGEISCPPHCTAIHQPGDTVTLTASPAAGQRFEGWGGDCAGSADCQLTMSAARKATAVFAPLPPPPAPETPGPGPATSTPPPPDTKLTRIKVRNGTATFRFAALGTASGFECALVRGRGNRRFSSCSSPKRYRHLAPRRYTFEVRATGPGGSDATPARKAFTVVPPSTSR